MSTAIVVAVIAGAVSAVGWVVNYVLATRTEKRRVRLQARLSHVERQLERLYGPLAFLIYEGRPAFDDLLRTLGRGVVFDRRLSATELELWLFWVDNEFMPRNAAIQTLLSSQTHLMVGTKMPESYMVFLDHYNSWRISHLRWQKEKVPYEWHSRINWPQGFEDEVISTSQDLKREHARLIGMVTKP